MYLSYKYDLEKGFIEGEIQYKYRWKGEAPLWMGVLTSSEINYLQGHDINIEDIDSASEFFYKRINELKKDITEMKRPYSEVMFELGYILHSINNILLPIYEGVHYPEQPLASNTSNLILENSNIEEINDLSFWMKKNDK